MESFCQVIAFWACQENSILEGVCENVVFLFCGYDQEQMNATMISTIASHIPAGTSSFTVLHYAQEIQSSKNVRYTYFAIFWHFYIQEEFCGFDWGTDDKNLKHHGSTVPPSYHLKDVNTKVLHVQIIKHG